VEPPHQDVKQLTPPPHQPSSAMPSRRTQIDKWREQKERSPGRYDLVSPEPLITRRKGQRMTIWSPFGVDSRSPNLRTVAGTEHIQKQLAQANHEDENTLGEMRGRYLAVDPAAFLPEPDIGPDDSFLAPADRFLCELKVVANTPCPAPAQLTTCSRSRPEPPSTMPLSCAQSITMLPDS
jgi:hypothetical protein